jgi:hypothetical protein
MQPCVRDVNWPSSVSVGRVLYATSRELRTLAAMTIQVQGLVSQLAIQVAPTDATCLGLQKLDHVTQMISGIASYLEALAATAPDNCAFDTASASHGVDLSDLASRLSFADPTHPSPSHRSLGDCLFFDGQD